MSLFDLAFTIFLLANPIGNSPAIVALLKEIDFSRQKKIMFRESMISFAIAVIFLFCGEYLLGAMEIENYSLSLCSGILLFFVALSMIFPHSTDQTLKTSKTVEPFIVPIATPLITGPSTMTLIMIYAKQYPMIIVFSAICLAWVVVTPILMSAPYLQKILGKRGLSALEQLMGMLLAMIAIESATYGIAKYLEAIWSKS